MKWYCDKCKKMHDDDELCPHIRTQLKQHPEWLTEAANFTLVAGEEELISTQALDVVAQEINKIAGTNLSYEGTKQFARDIQVFKRLNEETFCRSGHFSSPGAAKTYYDNVLKSAEKTPGSLTGFTNKLTGAGQEVDWLRKRQSEFSSLYQKSELLTKNYPGIDGITYNRFTGKTISRTTIKASINEMDKNSTGIRDVKNAIEKGTATEKDILFAPEGATDAARASGLNNPVEEQNSAAQIRKSNERLERKIEQGQATTHVTAGQMGAQMAQGAVVAAAVTVTVSSITNYVRYKNGEITRDEAYTETMQETGKGALTGAMLSAVTIFLPAGPLGFVAGMAVGIYISKTCSNILDEVYGNGAYGAILDSSGYIYGMTYNLSEYYKQIENKNRQTRQNIQGTKVIQQATQANIDLFEQMKDD